MGSKIADSLNNYWKYASLPSIRKVNGNIAPVETTSKASKAYAKGDMLVVNNVLYKASIAIAAGATLAVGTNLTAATVEDMMRTMESGLIPLPSGAQDGYVLTFRNGARVAEESQGGGGMLPQLVVTGPTTGSTVVAVNGSESVTLTENSGTWTGDLPQYGTWTVTATLGGNTASGTVSITEVKQYTMTLAYFTATLNITAPSGSTVTVKKGSTTIATHTGTGSAVAVSVHETGTYTVTATDGTNTATGSASITTDGQTVAISLAFVHTYGVSWDGSSTTAWTRTDEAAGFTDPVPAVNNGNGSSPFDGLQPWAGMTKVNRTGGVMVSIPKFWYKITQSGNGLKIQIADKAVDGFSVSPAHMDRGDGKGERDVVYVGRYHCANSTYKSETGKTPMNNQTRSTFRTQCHNIGSTTWLMGWPMRFTLFLLYLVEFADWNTQAKIGKGCGNNSGVQNMGYTDGMTYHTGTSLSSRDTYGLGTQYRWIEGLWDNVYDWIDECYNSSNGLMLILNPANSSDSSGGVSVGTPSSGYPSKFTYKSVSGTFPLFIPSEASGSETTYSCDGWNFSASYPCVFAGGNYYQYGDHGLFYWHCNSATNKSADIGGRLQELP